MPSYVLLSVTAFATIVALSGGYKDPQSLNYLLFVFYYGDLNEWSPRAHLFECFSLQLVG